MISVECLYANVNAGAAAAAEAAVAGSRGTN